MKCPTCDGLGAVTDKPPVPTPRLVEVLQGLDLGMSERETASWLHVSRSTVHSHVGRILRYFGVNSTPDAIAKARKWDVI